MQRTREALGGWIAAAGTVVILACAPAPALAAPLAFECDVPPDHVSELSQPAPGPMYSVTSRIFVEELRHGDNYGSSAGVQIGSPDGKQLVLLRFMPPSTDKKVLQGQLYLRNGDKKQTIDLGQVDAAAPFPVKLTLSEAGKVDLQVGDRRFAQDFIPLRTGRIGAFCSTGDYNFRDLFISGP